MLNGSTTVGWLLVIGLSLSSKLFTFCSEIFNIGSEGDLPLSRIPRLIRVVGRLSPIPERSRASLKVSVAWTRPRVGLGDVLIDHREVRIVVKCSSRLVQVLLVTDFGLARSFDARLALVHNAVKLRHVSIVACLACYHHLNARISRRRSGRLGATDNPGLEMGFDF